MLSTLAFVFVFVYAAMLVIVGGVAMNSNISPWLLTTAIAIGCVSGGAVVWMLNHSPAH